MLDTVPEHLVGRDAVLTIARTALADALAGTAQLVLVTGEPGIGKTAVLNALASDASERGVVVLRATCWDGGVPAYWPWIQILRAVPFDSLGAAAELLEPVARGEEAADARFRLCDAVAGLFSRLSGDSGLVVVLDDLQWADEASLQMLEFLAHHLGQARVLLLGAYRELGRGFSGKAQIVPLRGLGADEVTAVMTAVAGPSPDAELAARVWRRSGGNPLFVRELTRLMQVGPADAVPETVREILLSRLARLSQPCADLLGAAAVCGLAVRPELLGRLVGTNLDALEEAVTARVLTRGADGLRFSHDLYRETLRDGLPAGRRAALHSTAGRVLASLRDAGASVPASEVAAHFLAAGPDAVPEAVRYSALAGREAAARTAHSDAAAHYRAALNLAVAGPERRDLLVALAESLGHAGATAAAQSAYRDLAELAERTGDPFALASAALGLHGLGFRGVTATHLRLLSDAASQVPRDAFALRSQLLTALGRDLSITRSPGRASAIVREAGTLAAESGDARTLARALLAQHDIVWRPGGADERLAILADMADAADRAADPDLVAQAALLRATALIELGAPEGVTLLHTYVQLSERLGHARGRWGALSRHATLAAIAGRHAEARSFADSALKLGLMIGQPDVFAVHATLGLSLGLLAPRDLGAGLPGAEAESVPDLDVDPSDPVAPMLPMLRAALLLSAGATDRARAEFTGFAVPAAQMGYHLEMQAITASVAAAVGSTEQREQAYALLADYAGTHVVVGGCASYTGSVDHHLGMLCAALGRHAEAVAHLEAAVAQHERLGAPAWAELDRAELAKLADATAFVFRRDGRVWTLGFHGQEVHLPHTKGLADLATLLAKPGSDIPALELLGVPATTAAPVLDDQARRAYRARITQLDTAIAEATDDAERHLAERAELVRAITAAAGLGGRTRQLGSDAERARKAVSARIRDALDQILQAHPELGLHLRGTVRTGTYCGYHPSDPIHWRL